MAVLFNFYLSCRQTEQISFSHYWPLISERAHQALNVYSKLVHKYWIIFSFISLLTNCTNYWSQFCVVYFYSQNGSQDSCVEVRSTLNKGSVLANSYTCINSEHSIIN